jgi:serine/threonine protein kinase/tetratricopeptide (TPR) repeat protein
MRYCPTCQRTYPLSQRFCTEDGASLSLQDPYHLVGRTLVDRYRIDALVGVGGMGAVYSAHHLGIDRHVAIKILQPNIALGNEHLLGLFEREAKMIGHLNHENIANVMDAGRTSDGIAYIAMEWLDGRTLEEELAACGPLSFQRMMEILRQVAAALEAAHAKHIIHRDLKPANVMLVKREDGREQVKVLDFGVAKIVSETTASPVSAPMGTPHYASPEQFQTGGQIDGRSDIYSLGVMLYQMLTGSLPFCTTSVHELIKLQLTAPPPPLRQLRPDAPAGVEELVNRMLAKDPNLRPQRAGDVPTLLARACDLPLGALSSGDLPTRPDYRALGASGAIKAATPRVAVDETVRIPAEITSPSFSLTRSLKRHPRLAAGAALAVVALVAGLFYWRSVSISSASLSLAFVPFENLSPDRELDRLERIAPELLITKLAQVPGLEVASSQQMFDALKEMGKRPGERLDHEQALEAARRSGAGAVVTGSIIQVGARLRLTARVEDIRRGQVIFSGEIEGARAEEIFELADQLALRIIAAYGLNAQSARPVAEITTRSYDAYGFFQAGYDALLAHDFQNAITNLDKATRIDPNFALAYAHLGRARREAKQPGADEAFTKAMDLRDRAGEHDRLLIEAYYQWLVKRDRAQAVASFEQLIARYPKDKEALLSLTIIHRQMGQYDRSIEYGQRAVALDGKFGAALNAMGYSYLLKQDYVNAINTFKRYTEAEPGNPNPYDSLGDTYAEAGLYDEARAAYQRVFEIKPDFYDYSALWKLAEVYFSQGDHTRAVEYADRFLRNTREIERPLGYQTLARVELYRGRLAAARTHFVQARQSAQRAADKSRELQTLLNQAELAMGLRFYDDALRLIAEARRLLPAPPRSVVYGHVLALALRGSFEEARQEMAALDPKTTAAIDFELRARASYAQGDHTTALTLWQKLLELQPAITARKYDLALAHLGAGQAAAAERELKDLLKAPPVPDLGSTAPIHPLYDTRYLLAHYELGRVSEALGKRDQAVESYRKFLGYWAGADFKLDEIAAAQRRLEALK